MPVIAAACKLDMGRVLVIVDDDVEASDLDRLLCAMSTWTDPV